MSGPDAHLLVKLLEKLGWQPDAGQLAAAVPYLAAELNSAVLRTILRNLGFSCRIRKLPPDRIIRQKCPGVLADNEDRLWMVGRAEVSGYQAVRHLSGSADTDTRPLDARTRYDFIDFAPDTETLSGAGASQQNSFIPETFARFGPDLRLVLLLTLISGMLTVAFSIMVIFLFDLVVTGQQPRVIAAVLLAAGGLFVFDLVFRALKARLLGHVSGRFEYLIGSALFAKLLKLPRRMIDQAPISEQTVRLRELEGLRDVFSGPFAIVALELPVTLMLLAAIAFLSPALALVILGLIAVFFVSSLALVPALARRAASLSAARNRLTKRQMELIRKREVIARNGLAWPWIESSHRALNSVVLARYRLARTASHLEALSYVFVPLTASSVIFLGAERVIAGALSGGELVAVTMLAWRALAPLQQGLLILPGTRDLVRLFRQIDMMMRFEEDEGASDTGARPQQDQRLIAANLFLRGPHAHIPTLAGVSLEIPKGTFVSVVGSSGSGKSALLGVLAGQIQPQAGSVRLGNTGLTEMSNRSLGRQIMFIPQRPMLIYGTLAQNLRFIDPLIPEEQISAVLDEVGLTRLIARLPDGIHTRIDPSVDSSALTGGVRTAIAVAQALLMKPAVLLLDEPSEDVDPETDRAIETALKRRRDMTCLVVTHRPSLIRSSDAVLQIAEGRTRFQLLDQTRKQAS
ncbi:ATP-binding cassette domain-containing protein [uncultured Roseobacter sp.]|uniref:ATP-binding cassette domain-containing protein n=1 Tax=uncultured Roseobacter sp. TaxID=114847 RepID=UPI002629DDEA|nr:ATP-binding cassette domain-containing protein [uncultured Roseobacter sp.]